METAADKITITTSIGTSTVPAKTVNTISCCLQAYSPANYPVLIDILRLLGEEDVTLNQEQYNLKITADKSITTLKIIPTEDLIFPEQLKFQNKSGTRWLKKAAGKYDEFVRLHGGLATDGIRIHIDHSMPECDCEFCKTRVKIALDWAYAANIEIKIKKNILLKAVRAIKKDNDMILRINCGYLFLVTDDVTWQLASAQETDEFELRINPQYIRDALSGMGTDVSLYIRKNHPIRLVNENRESIITARFR